MADASLGTAVLRTRLDTTGLKTGLDQAKSETQKFGKDAISAVQGIGAAFGAVAASQGLRAYVSFMRSAAQEAVQAATAADLFEKAIRRNNESVAQGADMVDRLSDRFGVATNVIQDAATTMLRQGATIELVEKTLLTAGASAAAAGVDIATAFDNVTTAVVSGNSVLLRSSGIIAGLGQAEREYAREIGKTVEQLTEQEKLQARVNAIYEETRYEIEDLDRILEGLPRAQAEVTKQWTEFRKTAGGLAETVITPLTEGFGTMLRIVNDLPAPVKNAGIAMAGAATGATALATGIVAIKAALTGLSGLGLLSFGPAGWVVLGVTAVAGLAAALSGRRDSLDSAAKQASEAFNKGDANSLVGALDEVVGKFDGEFKAALRRAQEELRRTGTVGAESANVIVRAMESALAQAQVANVGVGFFNRYEPISAALNQAGASMFGDRAIPRARERVETALRVGNFQEAYDVVSQVLDLLSRNAPASGAIDALREFHLELARANQRIKLAEFTPPATPTGDGDGGGGGTGTGNLRQAVERTIQDVWNELGSAGLRAVDTSVRLIASGVDEIEANLDQLETRKSLLMRARNELLRDFYDDVTDAELEYLQRRLTEVDAELAALRAEPAPEPAPVGPTPGGIAALPDVLDAASGRLDAEAEELGASLARSLSVGAAREQMAVNARNREAARAIAADTEQAMADAAAAHEDYLVAIGHTDAELARFKANAAGLAAVLKDAADETARMGLFASAQARHGIGDTGLAGTSAAARGGVGITRAQANAQAAEMARDTVLAVTNAYLEGAASIDDVQTAVDALTELTPLSVKEINELTQNVLELARAANNAATGLQRAQEFEERGTTDLSIFKPFLTPEQMAFNERYSERAHRPRETGEADQAFIQASKDAGDNITMAGHEFALMAIDAGQGFLSAVESFRAGDVGGGIAGIGSTVGGITTALGGLGGALAGLGPWGAVISAGAGLLGGIVNMLGGGGNRSNLEATRAAGVTPRGAPAIDLSIIINQSLNVQSLTDPASRRAVDGLLLDTVQRIEDTLKRNVIPRLNTLEGGAA